MRFYERFSGFTTVKSFAFADQYSSEGENARVRSLVQRENERYRQAQRDDFNARVRDLAAFVKRKDPRVQKFLREEADEAQMKKQKLLEEKKLRIEQEQQAAMERQRS